jgi:hypothetical protein
MPTFDLCTRYHHQSVSNSPNETESKITFHVVMILLHYVLQKTRPQQNCIYLYALLQYIT